MDTHLNPGEIIDLVDGTLPRSRVAHAEHCAQCREAAEELRGFQDEPPDIEVPEPSPLFWEHQRASIMGRIAQTPAATWSLWSWRGAALATAGSLAVALVAVVSLSDRRAAETPVPEATPTVATSVAIEGDEAAWSLLLTAADAVEWNDTDAEPWPIDAGAVAGAVEQLSEAERQRLVRLLEAELEGRSL